MQNINNNKNILNIEEIYNSYNSYDNNIRKNAENQIGTIIENCNLSDFDYLFNYLINNNNNQINLFVSLIIKKYCENILEKNDLRIKEYILLKKYDIINIILNINDDYKINNILVFSFSNLLNIFEDEQYNQIFDDIFLKLFQFYKEQKNINNNYKKTFQILFIFFKFLKYSKNKIKKNFNEMYKILINDFNDIMNLLFSENNNLYEIHLEYINLYLKLFKYSLNYISSDDSKKILEIIFNFLNKILNIILNDNINSLSKYLFDNIFLSNKILIKYLSNLDRIDINIASNFLNIFYTYVENEKILNKILCFIQKQKNFLMDIIDFFIETIQIAGNSSYNLLVIFKNIYSDNEILISDYFNNYYTIDKIQKLLIFIIKNYLVFNINDIELSNNNPEEFYLNLDNLSIGYDMREKGGFLFRIICDMYKKELKDFFLNVENELLNLINKEINLYQNKQNPNFNDINLKLGIYSCFCYIAVIYFNKKRDYDKWINKILLINFENEFLLKSNEIFSKYLVIKIFSKILDYKELDKYRAKILNSIYKIFTSNNNIINFAIIDFLFFYFNDSFLETDIPNNFLEDYIIKICDLLQKTINPDIHSKIIKTSSLILDKFKDEEIVKIFPSILPVLQLLWNNNWDIYQNKYKQNNVSYNSIGIARKNIIMLLSIFIKKCGIFITTDGVNIINENYFNYIYNLIGISINIKSTENCLFINNCFNLLFLIFDEFFNTTGLSINCEFNSLKNPIENSIYYKYFIKIYDYLNIILDNLNNSNEFFIYQFMLIENYISYSFIKQISNFLENINFINKIIYILNKFENQIFETFNLFFCNFIEYLYFIIENYSYFNNNDKMNFENYIFNLINKIFNKISETQIISIINNKIQNDIQEDENMQKIYLNLNIYLCAIQLSSRLIYTKFKNNNIISYDFTMLFFKKFLIFYENLNNNKIAFNIIQKKVLNLALNNLYIIFNSPNFNFNINNDSIFAKNKINELYNLSKKEEYLMKNDKILNHYLYIFNKLNNQDYFYNLSFEEDKMRLEWSNILEKTGQYEFFQIEHKIKYYFLYNDNMISNN